MSVVLWHIELSHYSEKVRWALDHKGIPHVRRTPPVGVHQLFAMALTRSSHRRLPVLELDGRRIGDSTAIIAALEDHRPDPPLYPGDPEARSRALELEDFFDEELAPAVRRFVWHETLPDSAASAAALVTRGSPLQRGLVRAGIPLARPLMNWDYGIRDETATDAVRTLHGAMDRIERELQPSGYLVGDAFSVADLAGAALFTPLLAPPGRAHLPSEVAPGVRALRDELSARPGGRWVADMYRRHRQPQRDLQTV
jgi:glutathione S-transferase